MPHAGATCNRRLRSLAEHTAPPAPRPAGLHAPAAASSATAGTRPNVIWFLGDQHRAQATGYAGDPNLHTPNFDFLASEGVNFSKALSGYPLCCPFRGALLSGRYPHKSCPGHEVQMPPSMPTVTAPFRENGYVTAWIGKWHLDGFKERTGRATFHEVVRSHRGGFDEWLGYENNNSQYDTHVHGHREDGTEIPPTRLDGYETDVLTDKLLDFVRRRKADARPFFAAMSAQPPHNPYVAPPQYMRRHTPAAVQLRPNVPPVDRIEERARRELAGYYAAIENLDANLGRLIECLRENHMLDNTHIVAFADHGDLHGSHGQFMKTAPWEEAIRIPLIVGGGRRYEHRTGISEALVNHVDIAPTSLGLAGIAAPCWMEGTDYSHVRLQISTEATKAARSMEPDSALLQLVIPTKHRDSVDRPWRGIVCRDGWKYVVQEGGPWLLFNLKEDEYELANLAHNSAFAADRARCHKRLRQWLVQTDDSFVLPGAG